MRRMDPEDDMSETRAERAGEIGRAVFGRHDWMDTLDLVHDSLIDTANGVTDPVRHLRFAGHGLTVEVDVKGTGRLTFDVRVIPDQAVTVHMNSSDGQDGMEWTPDLTVRWSKPQLTSFTLRLADPEGRTVRTAWVLI